MTTRFSINKEQATKAGIVFIWAVASAVISFLISVIPGVQLPVEWQFLIPVVNSLLVLAKKFIEDQNGRIF